ncbi:MAG TPA: ARMT1-like domain-containing protein [Verrucomicrobiae bacterium]|nr:ARMT1-like domain-containing protein [Verrucomicrobiae bacterium]
MSVGLEPRLDCVACLTRQAHEAAVAATDDVRLREVALRRTFRLIARMDWHCPPPALAQQIHRLIRGATHNPDPYAELKDQLNRRAAPLEPIWRKRFAEAFPPFEAAVRMAIVGNLLDVAAKTQLGEVDVLAAFERALITPLVGSVDELEAAVAEARDILYLADNAGEIVFDRSLLSHLPLGNVTVVVRGSPILNDATFADACWAGLADFCDIMTNGSDAPGTLLDDCSQAFRDRFAAADLIIAKGQGNYESLAGIDKHVFFLLKIKCDVLGQDLGWPVGSLVLHHQRPVGGDRPHPRREPPTLPTEERKPHSRSSGLRHPHRPPTRA